MKKILICILTILSFLLFACEHTHNHTFKYIPNEDTHFKQYTCGCDSPDIAEYHMDNDNDNICDKCDKLIKNYLTQKNINTNANFTFFPIGKNNLHQDILMDDYMQYIKEKRPDLKSYEEYEIYNLIDKKNSEKYNIDIFQVCYPKNTYYYIKHNNNLYTITPFELHNQNIHWLNHIAITDINNDGYIEILTAVISCSSKRNSALSFIQITDTKTEYSIDMTDYDNIDYFKENENGVISVYNANKELPELNDINNGKLDEKYYYIANNLYDTPILNSAKYEFNEHFIKEKCDLFEVEITIDDENISFPYLFKYSFNPFFKINVKMTYLGNTFQYVNGDNYLDGATISFINENDEILCEPIAAGAVITKFIIYTGMVIKSEYRYYENLNNINKPGLYDMVISYVNKDNNINESIIIKDFLNLSR